MQKSSQLLMGLSKMLLKMAGEVTLAKVNVPNGTLTRDLKMMLKGEHTQKHSE